MKRWLGWATLAVGFVLGWLTVLFTLGWFEPARWIGTTPSKVEEHPEEPLAHGPWEIFPWDRKQADQKPAVLLPKPDEAAKKPPEFIIPPESPIMEDRGGPAGGAPPPPGGNEGREKNPAGQEESTEKPEVPPQQQRGNEGPQGGETESATKESGKPQQAPVSPQETEVQQGTQQQVAPISPLAPVATPQVPGTEAPPPTPIVQPEHPQPYQLTGVNLKVPVPPPLKPMGGYLRNPSPQELARLVALQSRYVSLGWRKFISYNQEFVVWVPGQLYYYLFGENGGAELYHADANGVLYGIQIKRFPEENQPVGATEIHSLLIREVKEWTSQYVAEDPSLRVVIGQYFGPDRNAKGSLDVSVYGPSGRTRLRILLTKDSLIWVWCAFGNGASSDDRFVLFLDGLDVL